MDPAIGQPDDAVDPIARLALPGQAVFTRAHSRLLTVKGRLGGHPRIKRWAERSG